MRPMLPVKWRDRSSLDWLLLASMAALAFNTHGEALPLIGYLVLLGVGLLWPGSMRKWWLWIAIAAIQGAVQVARWEGIDDHVIVGTYWALALGLGLAVGATEKVAATSGRWMIAIIFIFAATWKWSTPEFRDGSFFTLYLLADPRFSTLADLVGGASSSVFELNRATIGMLYELGSNASAVTLATGPRVGLLASAMTAWGLAIESAIAILWTISGQGRLRWARHVALFAFCATTYGLVAITGFGTILLVMGLATVVAESTWRRAYAVGIVVLAIWTPIWSQFVA